MTDIKKTGELIERLKCCWYILTMRNFYVSFYAKDMLQKNADGHIEYPKRDAIKGYYHIDDEVFASDKGTVTLRELICDNMIHIINKIKNRQL